MSTGLWRLCHYQASSCVFPEFEAEQDYMKTLSYLSPEEQKKHAARQAIAFMYQKPPGIDVVERKAAAQAGTQCYAAAFVSCRERPAACSVQKCTCTCHERADLRLDRQRQPPKGPQQRPAGAAAPTV